MKSCCTILLIAIAEIFGCTALWAVPATFPAVPIYVWQQPVVGAPDVIAKWRLRCGRSLVFMEAPGTPADPSYPANCQAWGDALDAAGVPFVINPNNTGRDAVAWAAMRSCAGLNQTDEPDRTDYVKPVDCVGAYNIWHAPPISALVWLNIDYSRKSGLQKPAAAWQGATAYATGAGGCDWFGGDLYPISAWGQQNFLGGTPAQVTYRMVLDLRATAAPAKSTYAYCETGAWNPANLANLPAAAKTPTAASFRGMNWAALIAGAKGLAWFPVLDPNIGSNLQPTFDCTSSEIAAEMAVISSQVQQYQDFISRGTWTALPTTAALGTIGATWALNGKVLTATLDTTTNVLTIIPPTVPPIPPTTLPSIDVRELMFDGHLFRRVD